MKNFSETFTLPKRKIKIRVEPGGRMVAVSEDSAALEAAWAAGARVQSPCGGAGSCGKCRVIIRGVVSPPDEVERDVLSRAELRGGMRLACRARLTGAATMTVLDAEYAGGLTLSAQRGRKIKISPRTRKITLSLKPPNLKDQRSDERRLRDAVGGDVSGELEIPIDELRRLPAVFRNSQYRVDAVLCGNRVISIRAAGSANPLGAAVDVGTTTLSVRLYDLATGERLREEQALNPQAQYGADVATRIAFASEGGAEELKKILLKRINRMIRGALAGKGGEDVCEVVAVGNPTMMHLMLGVDPSRIAPAPFIPAFTGGLDVAAREAGFLVNSNARLRVLPAVSAYIGADAVAAALAAGLSRPGPATLLADVGTNAEIILRAPGGLFACSAAAGPAFEGASLECGTWAREGAVRHVSLVGEVKVSTIGEAAPVGLCGGAAVDLVAELRRSGALLADGRLVLDKLEPNYKYLSKHFVEAAGQPRFLLNPENKRPVYLSQRDVRQVQLATGAIRAGMYFLLKKARVAPAGVKRMLFAGLLGSSLRADSVIGAGLAPPVKESAISYLGNAAIEGAALVLLQERRWGEAERLARKIEYIELSGLKGFQEKFIEYMRFP